jgi:ElaA protein
MFDWKVFKFPDLPPDYLYQALKLRQDIFILEQNCLYHDIDDLDQVSLHLFLISDNQTAGYLRIVPPGEKFKDVSLGRILVVSDFRGKKLGYKLVEKGIELATEYFGGTIRIEAQEYLKRFYSELGFKKDSDIYELDGINHLQMIFYPD